MQRVLKKTAHIYPLASPLMGQTGVIKLEILCLWLLSPLLLLLELLNVFRGHRKPYIGSVESQSDLPPLLPI